MRGFRRNTERASERTKRTLHPRVSLRLPIGHTPHENGAPVISFLPYSVVDQSEDGLFKKIHRVPDSF